MIILAHRGYWQSCEEKNQKKAFDRSVEYGFGVETDVRDHCGQLVISHDPVQGEALPYSGFLEIFSSNRLPLAINVKSDGLALLLKKQMTNYKGQWFAFDMSGPETLRYLDIGVPVFVRHSDVEPVPICYERALGVWLDAFGSDWFTLDDILGHLTSGKKVCIVSPELHGRDHSRVWELIKSADFSQLPDLLLCTDFPSQALEFFSV